MRTLFFAFVLLLTSSATACELSRPVVFAELDWDSVQFHTAVARKILAAGYGCKTDAVPGSTIPLIQGMAQGDIDVAMEIWKDNVTEVWTKALAKKQVRELGVNFPDAVQGWYIPRAVADAHTDLTAVGDLPRFKTLFADPEERTKGRFYNCPAGWSCEVVNTAKLRAYGLDAHFTNFRSGTGAALAAAIAGAALKHEPILAYYWGPTWVLGKYDMVRLAEPAWNETDWRGLAEDPNYPRAVAYPVVAVWIGANTKFAAAAPELSAFFSAYRTSSVLINEALGVMRDNGDSAAKAADIFLRRHPEVWSAWVPPVVAAKVRAALASG